MKKTLNLFDSHAHLDLINEKEITQILENAEKNNVKKIISCSTSFESNKKNLLLSKKYDEIECAIGLYPLNILELNNLELKKAFDFFEKNISKAIAIGEIGLDFKYCKNNTEQNKQITVFEKFIKLGKKYDKPLIVHSRYAQREVLEILEKLNAKKVLLHGFVESKKLIKKAIQNNYFISVGMIVLENELVQKNILTIPLKNLFFETDSPIRFNQKKVFSESINEITLKITDLKKVKIEQISNIQKENFESFFNKKM